MIDLVQQNMDTIASLCRRHGVKRLEIFGSAAREDFDPATSDLDFFVEFMSDDWSGAADHWFGLQEDLQALLGRSVDLVSVKTAKNPYFLQVANENRVGVYAA